MTKSNSVGDTTENIAGVTSSQVDEINNSVYSDKISDGNHQYVSRIGGRNGKETLQRIYKTVFSNKFAVLCSWLGHRGNFAIKNLQTTIVIKDIKLGEYADFKEKDIESSVSEWFRLAKLRLRRENEK
ncbi:hypothetical protein RN001_004534 [Aquatica leii]|uniref:DUF4806 domain-containing protein n=1 Tax=Aquatica leii TaxID=1421715 RepID=A0AAN7P5G4_9COLE|nr:hypothetical protein RN001_004534 [Aquatica leii]